MQSVMRTVIALLAATVAVGHVNSEHSSIGFLRTSQEPLQEGWRERRRALARERTKAAKEMKSLSKKVARAESAHEEVGDRAETTRRLFLGGVTVSWVTLSGTAAVITVWLLWFAFWYFFPYKTDRLIVHHRDFDGTRSQALAENDGVNSKSITADLDDVPHFNSPRMPDFDENRSDSGASAVYESSGEESQAGFADFVRSSPPSSMPMMGHQPTDQKAESRINPDMVFVLDVGQASAEREERETVSADMLRELFESPMEGEWSGSLPRVHGLMQRALDDAGKKPVTMREAQVALAQDIYDLLHALSFHVYAFSTIDDEQLFICATLNDPDVICHYCHCEGDQVQLAKDIAEKLRIGFSSSDDDCSSLEPSMEFDRTLFDRLREAAPFRLDHMSDLYNMGQMAGGSTIRVRHIFREITAHLNTRRAESLGLMSGVFPAHHRSDLFKLRASWSETSRLDQPISLMQQYFGEHVSFLFAWHGHYCKLILMLILPAVVTELVVYVTRKLHWHETETLNIAQLSFSYILIVWGMMALRLWQQEQTFWQTAWNTETQGEHTGIVRPEFIGSWQRSAVDWNMQEKQAPFRRQVLVRTFSVAVTMLSAVAVIMGISTWLHIVDGKKSTVASLLLAVQIKIFEVLFNVVAEKLTRMENHKYQTSFQDSWALKLFVFYCINYYYAFVHILVFQPSSKAGCPEGGCLTMLKSQMCVVYVSIIFVGILNVVVQDIRVRVLVAYEEWQILRRRNRDIAAGQEVRPIDELTLLEKQAKFADFTTKKQIEAMMQLMISLGFLLLFGAVAPIMVLPCAFVFVTYLHLTSFMLTHTMRRPFPYIMDGIGCWMYANHVLQTVGVLFTAYVVVTQEGVFKHASLTARLAGALLFIILAALTQSAVQMAFAVPDKSTVLLMLRRKHLLGKLNRLVLGEADEEGRASGGSPTHGVQERDKACRRSWAPTRLPSGLLTPRPPAVCQYIEVDWDNVPYLKRRMGDSESARLSGSDRNSKQTSPRVTQN